MTYAGVILGTAAYMAPEQAKGKSVDKRADIWAFGVVLYEMVTGRRPFQGSDVGDVLASVIKEEPNWNDLPVPVRRLVQRCLEKDPKKRLRDISGVELLLESRSVAEPTRDRRYVTAALWAMAGAVVAGAEFTAWQLQRAPADRPLVRLDVNLGSDVTLGSLRGPDVVVSPDGQRLVFVSQNRLWTRRLDQEQAVELGQRENPHAPFFSPDGQSIAFFSVGKLKRIAVMGGAAITLADGVGFGGSWGTDGYIVASLDGRSLSRIPEGGGAPVTVSEPTNDEFGHRWPQLLPGTSSVLFTAQFGGADEIRVLSLRDRRTTVVYKAAGSLVM